MISIKFLIFVFVGLIMSCTNQNILKVIKNISSVRKDYINQKVDDIRNIIKNENLLNSIKNKREKYYSNGDQINIFNWLNFNKKFEEHHSDILCSLLNLKYRYSSPFSDVLVSFYDEVIWPKLSSDEKLLFTKDAFIRSKVEREQPTDYSRKIDLFFSNEYFCIPIENKVDARDGKNQCSDYLKYAEKYNNKKGYPPILFYLTKFGTKPSEKSIKESDVNYKYLKCISWNEDILKWFRSLISNPDTPDKLHFFLRDYEKVIKEFCGDTSMDINEEAKKIIFESRDSLSATLEIVDTFEIEQTLNLRLFLDKLKDYLTNLISNGELKDLCIEDVYCKYDDQIESYYEKKGSYPFINLKTSFNHGNVWLSVRFEFHKDSGNAYVGIVSHSKDGKTQISDGLDKYFEQLIDKENKDGWWLCWKYIKLNGDILNIDNHDLYAELFNNTDGKEKREVFYKIIADGIKDYYKLLQRNDEKFRKNGCGR